MDKTSIVEEYPEEVKLRKEIYNKNKSWQLSLTRLKRLNCNKIFTEVLKLDLSFCSSLHEWRGHKPQKVLLLIFSICHC